MPVFTRPKRGQTLSAPAFGFLAATLLTGAPASAQGISAETEEDIELFNSQTYYHGEAPIAERVPDSAVPMMPTRPAEEYVKNTMMEPLSAEAKMRFMQSMMSTNPFSLRDMINMMVAKKKVMPGLSFDDVIESLKSKALSLNMREVGHNTPYKVLRETFDPESPRIEILSFCDLQTMRQILDYSIEFSAFVPCRVTVLEDADGQIWLTTLDWDVRWLDTSPNPNRIPADLREKAIQVRQNIEAIMQAAAIGDF